MDAQTCTCIETHTEERGRTAVSLIGVVLAVVVSVADVGRVGADSGPTLELTRTALELRCGEVETTQIHKCRQTPADTQKHLSPAFGSVISTVNQVSTFTLSFHI